MLTWGWRVPFLLAIITLVAAIALRYNMPESQEVRDRREGQEEGKGREGMGEQEGGGHKRRRRLVSVCRTTMP